jgi:hypothetical protein
MSLLSRLALLLALITAVLASASLCVQRARELSVRPDTGAAPLSLAREYDRTMELERRYGGTPARMERKEKIAAAVLAGEMTLREAAAAFAQAEEIGAPRDRPPLAGASEQERLCRAVIEWVVVKVRFERSPAEADAVRQRLKAQLQELLAGQGGTGDPCNSATGACPHPPPPRLPSPDHRLRYYPRPRVPARTWKQVRRGPPGRLPAC